MSEKPIVKAGGVATAPRVEAYGNRLEVSYPRMLTLGLTRKRETIPYRTVSVVDVKGPMLRVKLGTLSWRQFRVGRGNAKRIASLIKESM